MLVMDRATGGPFMSPDSEDDNFQHPVMSGSNSHHQPFKQEVAEGIDNNAYT